MQPDTGGHPDGPRCQAVDECEREAFYGAAGEAFDFEECWVRFTAWGEGFGACSGEGFHCDGLEGSIGVCKGALFRFVVWRRANRGVSPVVMSGRWDGGRRSLVRRMVVDGASENPVVSNNERPKTAARNKQRKIPGADINRASHRVELLF